MAEEVKPASAAGSGALAPVAPGSAGNKPATATAPVSAVASVPLFGGNRGGKSRRDRLVPGSPEAKEADRKRDAERKRQDRAEAARVAEPPPLPSALQTAPGAIPPPPGSPGPDAGVAGAEPAIPWDAELLKPLIVEAVQYSETRRVANFKEAAEEARLGEALVKQIAQDAHYEPAFKSTFNVTAPRALAKLLNRTGVSGQWSDEVLSSLSLLAIMVQGWKLRGQLEELIAQAKKKPEPPPNLPQPTTLPVPLRPPGAPPEFT